MICGTIRPGDSPDLPSPPKPFSLIPGNDSPMEGPSRSAAGYFPFYFAICLIMIITAMAAGCLVPPVPANTTQAAAIENSTIVSPSPALSRQALTALPITTPQRTQTRSIRNVVRGDPFTINGTVPDPSVTAVQVWVLGNRDPVTMALIPVLPGGTFRFTLDPNETRLISPQYSWVLIVQYPAPPDRFSVTLDNKTGEVTGSLNGTVTHLFFLRDVSSLYPTSLVDLIERNITKPGGGNSCDIYFLNGKDAWIAISPIGTSTPGTLTVQGETSLPAGTGLSITVGTTAFHPTPKNYDFSHEIH